MNSRLLQTTQIKLLAIFASFTPPSRLAALRRAENPEGAHTWWSPVTGLRASGALSAHYRSVGSNQKSTFTAFPILNPQLFIPNE
jgi:hypothetical protein